MLSASPQLRQLAAALRPALGSASNPTLGLPGQGSVDWPAMELARFANDRHRIGPLLHRAWSAAPRLTSDANAFLGRVAARNARRELQQKAATRKFGELLDANGIGWIEFKGWRLGEELYGESALRQSKDVDILLPPHRVADALTLAANNGYCIGGKRDDFSLRKALWTLRHHREVGILDPDLQVQIEVHSRMLGYPPAGWHDPEIGQTAGGGQLSINDPDYVLYLVIHGALTGWKRLKWLCDMVMLAQRISPDVRSAATARSRALGCEPALVASLLAVADLWDEQIVAPWLAETRTPAEDARVQGHLGAISRRLDLIAQPPFAERAMRHAGLIRDTAVFGRHPAPLRGLRDRAALWLLAKL